MMEVAITRIQEDFTEVNDNFRDGFKPWCDKEVDVMTVMDAIHERIKDGTKYQDLRCKSETTSSLDSYQICLASNRVCTTLARVSKRKPWFLRRKEVRVKERCRAARGIAMKAKIESKMCLFLKRIIKESTSVVVIRVEEPGRFTSIMISKAFLAGPDYREDLRGDGPHRFPHGTDPNDPAWSGRILEPHPCTLDRRWLYESKQLRNGGLYVRVDMPGVPKDKFTVSVKDGRVMMTGQAPAISHDSSGRVYSGDVAMLSTRIDLPSRKIKTIAKNGVLRLVIPPV